MKGEDQAFILPPSSFILPGLRRSSGTSVDWLGDRFSRFIGAKATIFVSTVAKGTLLLRCLLEQEWSVAVWTGSQYRFVPIDHVAVGILRAAVKYFPAF